MSIYCDSFIYDGIISSDFGLIISSFNPPKLEENSSGSTIKLNASKVPLSNVWKNYNSEYDRYIEFDVEVSKSNFSGFDVDEISTLNRWLIRKDDYRWFQFYCMEFGEVFLNATAIQCEQLTICEKIYGLRYKFVTNSPFAYTGEQIFSLKMTGSRQEFIIYDNSDEIGFIYPALEIQVLEDGDLEITNLLDNRTCGIKGCTAGEVIQIDQHKGVKTNNISHSIFLTFNWIYPRIFNTFQNRENKFMIKTKCDLTMKWRAIRKVGV